MKLRDEAAKRDTADAEAEVDYLVRCGAVPAAARKSLLMHRKSDPTDFGATYADKLASRAKGDAPHLFARVAAPGGTVASDPKRNAAPSDAEANDAAFEREVDAFLATAEKRGEKFSRSQAITAVHNRLFDQAVNG